MVNLTHPQRQAVARIYSRVTRDFATEGKTPTPYRTWRRRSVRPGPGCVMLYYAGMWLGIEPDGYTHS